MVADGSFANTHHVIGSLVLTVVSIAAAEVARPVRYLNVLPGAALMGTSFMLGADLVTTVVTMVLGAGLIVLSIRRGPIRARYGNWNRLMIQPMSRPDRECGARSLGRQPVHGFHDERAMP